MSKSIRLYTWEGKIRVCPHISISGKEDNDNSCEYIETLEISCEICKKRFEYDVLIN